MKNVIQTLIKGQIGNTVTVTKFKNDNIIQIGLFHNDGGDAYLNVNQAKRLIKSIEKHLKIIDK